MSINPIICHHAEKLLVYYANEYKERPKSLLSSYLKFDLIKYGALLVVFACKKNGLLKELEGKKDFSEWVNKQPLDERWKPVLNKFLIILWGVNS